jgi:topoisomerase-4 subunit A
MIRITRFDSDKADDFISKLEEEMKEVHHNLEHLTDFAIAYFTKLKEK